MSCSIGPVERVQQACNTCERSSLWADEGQGRRVATSLRSRRLLACQGSTRLARHCSLGAAVALQSLSLRVCLHGILARGCGVCVESAPGCMAWGARYNWCALRPAFAYTVLGGRNGTLLSAPGCVALGARYSWCAARQASLNSMFSVVSDGSDSGHRRSSKRPQCAVDMWMRIWNTWPCATPQHPPQQVSRAGVWGALGGGSGVQSGCRNDLHNVACPGLYCRPPQQTSRASLPGRSCMSMLRHRLQHLPA